MSKKDPDAEESPYQAAPTTDSGGQDRRDLHTRMHFHAVHHGGEQLRRGKRHAVKQRNDRMVGR